jgi:ribonuclease VapC
VIVDTSALVTIAFGEPDAERLIAILRADPAPRISAANMLETYVVIDGRRGAQAAAVIEESVTPIGLIIESVTEAQVDVARDAYRRYGKGSGHPARLNFGDCFAGVYPEACRRTRPRC